MPNFPYQDELENALETHQRILLRTDKQSYFEDCLEVLFFLTNTEKRNALVISFDTNNENLIHKFLEKGGDIKKLQIIDGANIDSLEEIDVSVNSFLTKIYPPNTVVVFISLHAILTKTPDEIAIFLERILERIDRTGAFTVMIMHTSSDFALLQIVSSKSKKIVPIRKELLIKG